MSTTPQLASEMTEEQLEQLLKAKKAAKAQKLAAAKKKYETERDNVIDALFNRAIEIQQYIKMFKEDCANALELQHEKLEEYGKIRSNSKGGFTIKHSNNQISITRRRDTEPQWDERSSKAIALIKDFLSDTVKKRDQKMFEILMSFLQRNINGDLQYSRVMDLLLHEDKFDDERWKEGLRLIKESYSNVLRAYGYEFKHKPEEGEKWETIMLNFSSL